MKRIRVLFLLMFVLAFINGCVVSKNADGSKSYSVDPKFLNKAEEVGESTVGLAEALAPLLGPAGGIVAGGLATGLAVLKKVKPKLEKSQKDYELSNTVASISVEAIEQIKKDHPQVWDAVKTKITKECEESGLDTRVVKNAIRGLRGLPPKT
jgi:hypothetical protein